MRSRSKRRLADEYDAAQERGEVATRGGERSGKEHSPAAPAAANTGITTQLVLAHHFQDDDETDDT
jgi:hypothetical protein